MRMDHSDDASALAECCDATSGRTAPGCGFDASLERAAFEVAQTAMILGHRIVQARAPDGLAPETPLDPPKI